MMWTNHTGGVSAETMTIMGFVSSKEGERRFFGSDWAGGVSETLDAIIHVRRVCEDSSERGERRFIRLMG